LTPLGVIAAGHPLTARAGGDVLRAGGNAVDAAIGAVLASFACEPLLSGLGAGGYMLVVPPARRRRCSTSSSRHPGEGPNTRGGTELVPISVSFGDAIQVFNIGAASVGTYGTPAGLCAAAARYGRLELAELVHRPPCMRARGWSSTPNRRTWSRSSATSVTRDARVRRACSRPTGPFCERVHAQAARVADALERLGAEGAAPSTQAR